MIIKNVYQQKHEIRSRLLKERKSLSSNCVELKSNIINRQLIELPEFRIAESIHCYVAWRNEVNTHALIKELLMQRRQVVIPLVDVQSHSLCHFQITKFEDLKPGTFGILEPPETRARQIQTNDIDLIIVPAVAFDMEGNRLGFGGGYYDKFLKNTTATKVGLAFQFQILDQLPTRILDERIDILVSEKGVYRFEK